MRLGPDATRYLAAGCGTPVPRPFHLRWLLPTVLGDDISAWRAVWLVSWPVLGGAMFGWAMAAGLDWRTALAAAVLLMALPGILGPQVSIPVGVDLPATALGVGGVALIEWGHPAQIVAGVLVLTVAAAIRETTPVWAALWLWSPWPLIALAAPLVAGLIRKPGPDPLGPTFQEIADHPVRTALQHHAGRWRDGWLMVAPWGACVAALVGIDWRLILLLVLAYGQLVIATDSVRLYQHAAGPAVALTAAQIYPTAWLPLVAVVHVVWWWKPERI